MLTLLLIAQATQAPISLHVHDVAGNLVAVPAPKAKATVLLFVGVDCPIANRMAPEISRIFKDYAERGVVGMLVYPDGTLKPAAVKEHMKSFGFQAIGVIDGRAKLVKATHASVTPQAVVVDPNGNITYSGRINDLFEEHGKIRAKVTRNDLRVSLDEMLAGKPVSVPRTQLVGCFIAGG